MNSKKNKTYSIKDIAKLSGVSTATLSRYFNGQAIKASTEEKIKKVLTETDYRPNRAARFIQGRGSGIFGLIVPEITHPFFSLIAEGVMRRARQQSKLILCGSSEGSINVEKQIISDFSQSVLDGLIYIPVAHTENIPDLKQFKNLPIVIAARRDIIEGVPHIYHDSVQGGYLATKHLLKLGRENIAYIASFWEVPCTNTELYESVHNPVMSSLSSIDRFRGYIKALDEYGIPYRPELVVTTGYGYEDGVEAASLLHGRFTNCNGVVAMTQTVANGFAHQTRKLGYSIPKNISIVIFDSKEQKLDYSYTYVELDLVNMGEHAVDSLIDLTQEKPVTNTIIPVELVVRETSSTFLKRNKS